MRIKEYPQEVLDVFRTQYSYNPETGLITNTKTNKTYTKIDNGYIVSIRVTMDNITYAIRNHRLCWFLGKGELLDSSLDLDHKNNIRSDNRLDNLRKATQSDNSRNRVKRDKLVGISYVKSRNKYVSKISIEANIEKQIGYFKDEILAAKFYDSAARYYHKEFASCNFDEEFLKPMSIEELRKCYQEMKDKI